jgi:PDZ domain-containing protein
MSASVPAEEASPDGGSRWKGWLAVAAVVLVIGTLIGASTVELPYYAIAPGGTLDVGQLVAVDEDTPVYRANGSVLMTTVSLQRTTLVEAVRGWLDPTIDVVAEEQIRPKSVGADEAQQQNLQAMASSKELAAGVAFEQLGYDAIDGSGAEIVDIVDDSPADGTLEPGDTITAIDGDPVELHTDAVRLLRAHAPGDEVRLTVDPKGDGADRDLTVRLASNPEKRSQPMLGVQLSTRGLAFDFPHQVTINSEGIGGPSAGFAFTLEVLDLLTPGELTGGHRVAATGTIELDGTVGEVGGVAQKTVAVRRAGAELFLVPAEELAEARAHAGTSLRVEPVRDLDDALRILASLGGNGLALGQPGRDGA